jgi:hypothetical protein
VVPSSRLIIGDHLQHDLSGFVLRRAGWLIAEQNPRPFRYGRYGDLLLLAPESWKGK